MDKIFNYNNWSIKENNKTFSLNHNVKFFIKVDTQEDYWELMRKLEELGYNWGSKNKPPTSENYFNSYKDLGIYLHNINGERLMLNYSSLRYFDSQRDGEYSEHIFFKYKDFDKYIGKKYKKIERPEIDPMNEEDWGFEEIKESNDDEFVDISNLIINVHNQDEYWELIEKLQKFGYKWSNSSMKDNIYKRALQEIMPGRVCLFLNPNFTISYGSINFYSYYKDRYKNRILIDYKDFDKYTNKKYKKIKNPEIDPFNEEEWGFEEINESTIPIEWKIAIKVNTEDYNELMKKLRKIGYRWYADKDPFDSELSKSYKNNMCIYLESDLRLTHSSLRYFEHEQKENYHLIEYKDFDKYLNKKYKKIEKPEIDPFNEEDWGIEEID